MPKKSAFDNRKTVGVVIPGVLNDLLQARAKADWTTTSDVIRRALADYLTK